MHLKFLARGTGSAAALPVAVSRPVAGSTTKLATPLWPRFGAKRNRPEAVIRIWEQVLFPV